MDIKQQINYMGKQYEIIKAEQNFIIHPAAFGLLPAVKASLKSPFSSEFHIENYRLMLDNIALTRDGAEEEIHFQPEECKVSYSGAFLIAANPIREYYLKDGKLACYSYQNVLELVFEDGMLITTVDQSKAMLRIRKNIDMGFRSLNVKRDLKCINRFMNSSLVGDYESIKFTLNRFKYLKDMCKNYEQYS